MVAQKKNENKEFVNSSLFDPVVKRWLSLVGYVCMYELSAIR